MMKMQAGKYRLWQGVFRDGAGGYAGYFSGTDPIATFRTKEWAANPVAHLKFFLVKQGWSIDTIKKLIGKSFDTLVVESTNKAK